jgi:uroporphyrin-III C-methyltransferase/precorrin-2 dehydrogenase/sirohydrochlorin ferrochelatase
MDVLPPPRNDGPARMEPLAKLPVFWALEGKRVVVAGGSDAAAWKAELLAACGAHVDVYADVFDETFETLLSRTPGHPAAKFTPHRRSWTPGDLGGASLAIADCADDADARAFSDAARAAGVPANVIDKPEFCQFQFGSIVNRSPVVIAISTDGAAPILAQALRRKIEALLPRSLKSWATLAQSLRGAVNRRLAPGQQRRAFWERFSDLAFTTTDTPEEGVGGVLLADAERLAEAPALGCVMLVGAGPGDAELLTLKAMRALQSADIIFFDDLVSAEVLELARREAKRVQIGVREGRRRCRQEEIGGRMARLAKAGKRVVRLVPGDPTMFSDTSNLIALLGRENIPVHVIPGITGTGPLVSRDVVAETLRSPFVGQPRSGGAAGYGVGSGTVARVRDNDMPVGCAPLAVDVGVLLQIEARAHLRAVLPERDRLTVHRQPEQRALALRPY